MYKVFVLLVNSIRRVVSVFVGHQSRGYTRSCNSSSET